MWNRISVKHFLTIQHFLGKCHLKIFTPSTQLNPNLCLEKNSHGFEKSSTAHLRVTRWHRNYALLGDSGKSEKPEMGGQNCCQIYHKRGAKNFIFHLGEGQKNSLVFRGGCQNICHVILNSITTLLLGYN